MAELIRAGLLTDDNIGHRATCLVELIVNNLLNITRVGMGLPNFEIFLELALVVTGFTDLELVNLAQRHTSAADRVPAAGGALEG